jgi:hypothetical protein
VELGSVAVQDLAQAHKDRVDRVVYWAMQVVQAVGPATVAGLEAVEAVVELP